MQPSGTSRYDEDSVRQGQFCCACLDERREGTVGIRAGFGVKQLEDSCGRPGFHVCVEREAQHGAKILRPVGRRGFARQGGLERLCWLAETKPSE